jgi:ribosome-binding protein aMBF1 (putative translation factor)
MKTLEIHIPEDVAARIEAAAEHRGLSLDDLIRASVEEKLNRDDQFERAAGHVLAKNAELYERLS